MPERPRLPARSLQRWSGNLSVTERVVNATFDRPFGIHADALPIRQQRLQVLAANLANAETPGFKARDIDFAAALRAAQVGQGELAVGSARHIAAPGQGADDPAWVWRLPTQPSLDGNTVETHIEQAEFARAALEYRASLTFLEGRIRSLLTAITGQ